MQASGSARLCGPLPVLSDLTGVRGHMDTGLFLVSSAVFNTFSVPVRPNARLPKNTPLGCVLHKQRRPLAHRQPLLPGHWCL